MPKYCKTYKKQDHKEAECWMINPKLRQFEEQSNDKGKEKEIVGTTAASTKVLSSGKVLAKPIPNHVRQKWM